MPKQTYFDLSDKKQQSVINAAYEEFLAYPYKLASIARISKNAGISVGSFYQYFEDKYDLVQYMCSQIVDHFVTPHNLSYWQLLDHEAAKALGISEREYTFLFEVINRFPSEVQNRLFFDTLDSAYIRNTKKQLSLLLSEGKLRDDIDLDFVAYVLSAAPLIVQEFGERKGFSKDERFAYNKMLSNVIDYGIRISERGKQDGDQNDQ